MWKGTDAREKGSEELVKEKKGRKSGKGVI